MLTVRHFWNFGEPPPEVEKWVDEYLQKGELAGPCPHVVECHDPRYPDGITRHIFNDCDYINDYRNWKKEGVRVMDTDKAGYIVQVD